MKASDNSFPKVILDMQTSTPSAPSNEDWKLFAKPDGVYARSSNSIVGPFGASSVSYGSNSTRVSTTPSAGASTLVARADHVHDATSSSGAGLIDFDQIRLTTGNKTLNSTNWTNLDTGMDLVLTAQDGDVCEVTLHGLYENQNVGAYIDCMTLVSAAGVHWFGNGEPTSSTGNGVIGWSKPVAATTYQAFGASVAIVLASGDLSGGTVTLRLRYRTGAASNLTLRASSGDALIFQAKIWRP